MHAQAFDVTNEKFLETSQQVWLLGLPDYVDNLDLEGKFWHRVEFAEDRLDCKLEDRQVYIFPDLGHCVQFVVQRSIFIKQGVL